MGQIPVTTKKRRWILGFLLLAGLVLLAWALGIGEFLAKQMAWSALGTRNYDRALFWADRANRGNSGDAEAEFLLGRIARKQGRMDDFSKHSRRAETLGFDRERIRRERILSDAQTGNIERTREDLPRLLMDQQGDGAEICEAFSNCLLINGVEDEAKKLIELWSAAFPHDPHPDVLHGRLAEFHTRPNDAERHYHAALKKSQNYPPALFGLARTLGELNRWQEAAELYQVGLKMPLPGPAQYGLARCLRNLGREDEAFELLQAAAAIPAEQYSAALRDLGEPTENDSLATELGTLEANRGHTAEAVRWLQRALDYNPKHRAARYQLAKALQANGDSDQAQPHFDYLNALETKLKQIDRLHDDLIANPENVETRYQLGLLSLDALSEQAGVFWLRSVLARQPDHQGAKSALLQHFSSPAKNRSD